MATATATAKKTVLITGSSRGIGLEFAVHYAAQGWNVIAAARSPDAADERLAPWKLLPLDMGDEASILAAAKAIEGVPVDLLINNAGVYHAHGLDATSKNEMLQQFSVNTVGPFLLTRALLPNLRLAVAQRGAAFVAQVSSVMGSIASNTSGGSYGSRASKAALNMITKSLAVDLREEKIWCLLLHPGFVKTKMANFEGEVTPEESVAAMTRIIDRATLDDLAKLLHYETGNVISW